MWAVSGQYCGSSAGRLDVLVFEVLVGGVNSDGKGGGRCCAQNGEDPERGVLSSVCGIQIA